MNTLFVKQIKINAIFMVTDIGNFMVTDVMTNITDQEPIQFFKLYLVMGYYTKHAVATPHQQYYVITIY